MDPAPAKGGFRPWVTNHDSAECDTWRSADARGRFSVNHGLSEDFQGMDEVMIVV